MQTREGVPCVAQPAQVAGGRTGSVDLRLALFEGAGGLSPGACRPLQTNPSAKRACDIGWGFGNAEELEGNDAFLRRARSERRLLAGRTTVYGRCSADVERVTVRTPRDVRTLVPSAVGHAILAVYDGDFPAGELEITAHLRGGKTWTERHPLGF